MADESTPDQPRDGEGDDAHVTAHLDNLRGDNAHHQAETLFKAFGRALRSALTSG